MFLLESFAAVYPMLAWLRALFHAPKCASMTAIRKTNLKVANLRKDFDWLIGELEMKVEAGEDMTSQKKTVKANGFPDFSQMTEQEQYEWAMQNQNSIMPDNAPE